jgi:uncharacterized protein (TIGR02118 family)
VAFQLIVLYNHPEDASAFDKHYDEIHAPLAARFPGLRSYTISRPAPGVDGSPAPYYLVAVLTFDDETALNAAMAGEVGQAAVADLADFAGAGVTIMTGPAETVV